LPSRASRAKRHRFFTAQQPVLERRHECADGKSACSDLPVRDEPVQEWQQLAWAGALLITLAVLLLNICALRTLFRQGATK
jgi:hypothetical protein